MMMNATCWQCNRFPFSSLNVVRTESLHPAMIFGSPFLSLSLSLSAGTCIISTYRFQLPPQNCVISINYVFLSLPPSGAAFDWSTFSRYFLNYLFIDRYDDVAVGRSMDRYRYFHSRFFLPSFLPSLLPILILRSVAAQILLSVFFSSPCKMRTPDVARWVSSAPNEPP